MPFTSGSITYRFSPRNFTLSKTVTPLTLGQSGGENKYVFFAYTQYQGYTYGGFF